MAQILDLWKTIRKKMFMCSSKGLQEFWNLPTMFILKILFFLLFLWRQPMGVSKFASSMKGKLLLKWCLECDVEFHFWFPQTLVSLVYFLFISKRKIIIVQKKKSNWLHIKKKMFKRLGTWSTISFTNDQPIFSWNKIIIEGNGCTSFHFQATHETSMALKLDYWVTKFQSS